MPSDTNSPGQKNHALEMGHKYIQEIEDVAFIHQLLIGKLRTNNTAESSDKSLSRLFYIKPIINFTKDVNEVEPEIDEINKVLLVQAPLLDSETQDQKEQRRINLIKDFLPVIGSMNIAISKDLFNWFISTAASESIEKFMEQLSKLKNQAYQK